MSSTGAPIAAGSATLTAPSSSTNTAFEFWLLADTQIHNVTAGYAKVRDIRLDKYAPGAIRPPTTDLWTGMVLRRALEEMRSTKPEQPIFFLGDASDISCTSEMAYFFSIVSPFSGGKDQRPPMLMALGNHDGYYEGNIIREPDLLRFDRKHPDADPLAEPVHSKFWSEACWTHDPGARDPSIIDFERQLLVQGHNTVQTHAFQRTLAKSTAVLAYLKHLKDLGFIDDDPLNVQLWKPSRILDEKKRFENVLRFESRKVFTYGGAPHQYQVVASLTPATKQDHGDRQWRAYIVQDYEVDREHHALIIDTSDPSKTPLSDLKYAIKSALKQISDCHDEQNVAVMGECARFSTQQASDLQKFREQWANRSAKFVILAHHNLYSFGDISKAALLPLLNDPNFVSFISAHTHYPASRAPIDERRWEVNIGSMTDPPIRYVNFSYDSARDEITTALVRPASASCFFDEEKGSLKEELDYGEEKYLVRAAKSYRELFDHLPTIAPGSSFSDLDKYRVIAKELTGVTDPIIIRKALTDLVTYDRTVLQGDSRVREAEASCALWASEGEDRVNGSRHHLIPQGTALKEHDTFRASSTQ